MEPFNIKITVAEERVALTILPTDEGYFKVVYYGGVLGGIKYLKDSNSWEAIPVNELSTSDLPPYKHKEQQLEIQLDEATVTQIGNEIETYKLGSGKEEV